ARPSTPARTPRLPSARRWTPSAAPSGGPTPSVASDRRAAIPDVLTRAMHEYVRDWNSMPPMTTTPDPAVVRDARRLVVKVGSSSLTGPRGGLDGFRVQALATTLAKRALDGVQVVLVSSGAIAAGMGPL